jgi:hypothetical protein
MSKNKFPLLKRPLSISPLIGKRYQVKPDLLPILPPDEEEGINK